MRWTSKDPELGETRQRRGFLWLPKTIGNETRWLEFGHWEECYGMAYPPDHPEGKEVTRMDVVFSHYKWHPFRWLSA